MGHFMDVICRAGMLMVLAVMLADYIIWSEITTYQVSLLQSVAHVLEQKVPVAGQIMGQP